MTLLELIGRDTALRKHAGTDGGVYIGPCPWCEGDDRFHVWPNATRPRYWCRKCDRKGDAIQYLRDRHHVTYPEACRQVGRSPAKRSRSAARPSSQPSQPITPPAAAWQAKAREFCEQCEQRLWAPVGCKALAYLHRRGLQDDTILGAGVGYHQAVRWERRDTWGLPPDPEGKPLWVPPGIVFPWAVGGDLWKVTIRRFGNDVPYERRHIELPGGANAVYRLDTVQANRPVGIVEAALDALSLAQEAGDLLAVVAAGTSWGRLDRWVRQLALSSKVLLMFDADEGGEKATAWWLKALGLRATRWRPYWDDPNAMLQDQVDLRIWVREGLGMDPKWWRELACWPEEQRELWAERAAIMEVEGTLSRDDAERHAFERLGADPAHAEYGVMASDVSGR